MCVQLALPTRKEGRNEGRQRALEGIEITIEDGVVGEECTKDYN